jgi:D-arginine utilization repressor
VDALTTRWAPVCEAIARLLSPHGEVVLHDAVTDRILGIWNAFSGRSPGDPSLLGELDALSPAGTDVYGPYPKSLSDGRRLSSVSAVIRDAEGRAEVVLCVNVDRSAFDGAARLLSGFAATTNGRPQLLFELDWTETLNEMVAEFVRDRGTPVERLDKQQRRELLSRLDGAGIFTHRRSVPVVAQALRMSRSAAYQLLAEMRKETDANTS